MSASGGFTNSILSSSLSADPDRNDRRRLSRSLVISAVFWALVCVLSVFVPLAQRHEPKRAFQSVTITLAPDPREGKAVKAGKETQAPAVSESAASPRAKAASPKAGKSARATAASATSGSETQRAAPSPSTGLGIPDFAPETRPTKRTDTSGDFLEFGTAGTEAGATQARSASETATATTPELEGSVAAVQHPQAKPVRASSGGKKAAGTQGAASAETSRALGDIAGAAGKGALATGSSGGASGEASANVVAGQTGSARAGSATATSSGSQGSGAVSTVSSLAFEGSPRRLLYPASPAITLPESLARTVDSNRSVTVSFTVLADGSVPSALVRFTPQAALSPEIRDYLTKEFSRWRFEKSAQDGQARFLYSIKMQ
ncbi:MAG TPA: hypothetical protein PKL75_09180 [Treponemataceae bacterium]|nr:hypothetical protein [Treponemataceae bacterium]